MPMSPSEDAIRLLKQVWLDGWGNIKIPVDPIRIADQLGIRVYESAMDDDVSGLLIKEADKDATIFLNEEDHVHRQRFTCAHEIGHFLRRRDRAFQYVDKRDVFSSAGVDPEEIYANGFAAELLMPREAVVDYHADGLRDYEMALRFKVSLEAMRHRLNTLRLADDAARPA